MEAPQFELKVALLITLCIIADLVALEMTYPFLTFMVENFGIANEKRGLYVGILGSAFGFGQAVFAPVWGRLADRKSIGRKIPLLVGLFGNFVAMALFGLSSNFTMAVCITFLQGVMNGNYGLFFTVLADANKGEHLGKAFGFAGIAYGVGLSLSSVIGGLTSNPAEQYPALFGGLQFFEEYPFFLPCVISAAYIFIVWFIVFWKLPETHPEKQRLLVHHVEAVPLLNQDTNNEADAYPGWTPLPTVKNSMTAILFFIQLLHWLGTFGFAQMFGVWASGSIQNGGLDFGSTSIGFFFISWGLLLPLFYKVVWPKMILWRDANGNHLTCWNVARIGILLAMIEVVCFPFLNTITKNKIGLWIALEVLVIIGVLGYNIYPLTFQMIINASVVPQYLGSINGLMTTAMAVAKAAGPIGFGAVFTWSIESNHSFPFDFHLVFVIIGIALLLMIGLTFLAKWVHPHSVNIRMSSK